MGPPSVFSMLLDSALVGLLPVLGSYFLGRWIVKPLRAAALKPPPPTQYYLADIYVLLGQLGLAGLALFGWRGGRYRAELLVGMFIVWALLAWWWWLGARALSHAKVARAARRAVFLGLGGPLAFGCLWPVLLLPMLNRASMRSSGAPGVSLWQYASLELCAFFIMTCFAARTLARWTAAGAEKAEETVETKKAQETEKTEEAEEAENIKNVSAANAMNSQEDLQR